MVADKLNNINHAAWAEAIGKFLALFAFPRLLRADNDNRKR